MRRIILSFLLLFSAMLSAQTLTQTIRGTVVDSESKFPLADAMVVCDASQAFTDEYGQFGAKLLRSNCLVMSPRVP